MEKLYIVANTWQDIDMSIEEFYTNHKALKFISEMCVSDGFRKPNVNEDAKEYLAEFYSFVADERDNQCEHTIALLIIKLN